MAGSPAVVADRSAPVANPSVFPGRDEVMKVRHLAGAVTGERPDLGDGPSADPGGRAAVALQGRCECRGGADKPLAGPTILRVPGDVSHRIPLLRVGTRAMGGVLRPL